MGSTVLKVASSAVLGGTISEIGGGKFANGAVTRAYSMLFNHVMHQLTKMTSYNKKVMGQVPLDENVGMQMATYGTNLTVIEDYANNKTNLNIRVLGTSWDSGVEGDVNVGIEVSLILNGKVAQTIALTPHFDSYNVSNSPKSNIVGEAYLEPINPRNYRQISIQIKSSWFVEVSPGHRSVPTYVGTGGIYPIGVNVTHKIK